MRRMSGIAREYVTVLMPQHTGTPGGVVYSLLVYVCVYVCVCVCMCVCVLSYSTTPFNNS